MIPYLKITESERKEMLSKLEIDNMEELFNDIPKKLRVNKKLKIPNKMSEIELINHINEIGKQNVSTDDVISFLGGGVYNHYIPPMIDQILMKPEFYTAYTPYQPEISQGTLQAIFEFQTMICEITGLDVSNASVYDGATAASEAMNMACNHTKRNKILIASTLNPETKNVLKTYAVCQDIEIIEINSVDGVLNIDDLEQKMNQDIAMCLVQNPNYLGQIEDCEKIEEIVHKTKKTLFGIYSYPMSLGILKSPGELNADIAIGDGQCFGISQGFGGPHLGFMAAKKNLLRKLPGRIVGETEDKDGKRAFVLTLQAREQHIRREKASSNICSNQSLLALANTVYLSMVGREGFKKLAIQITNKAHYLQKKLLLINGVKLKYDGPFFNEFVIEIDGDIQNVLDELFSKGYYGGIKLTGDENKNCIMIAVTEKHTKNNLDDFADALEEVLS